MSESRFDVRRDGLGILLFTVGSFFSVLFLKADGSAPARLWTAPFGALPSLVFNAGLAWLGARIFLRGSNANLRRNVGGLALVSLGLAVCLGSFSATGGG